MPHWEFPGSDPIDASVDLASGRVTVDCRPVPATTVDVAPSRFSRNAEKLIDEIRVTYDHGRLEVTGPRRTGLFRGHAAFDVTITLPEGSRCRARTASADITCNGELAGLDAHAASGDITAASVTGQLQAETSSGDVRLDETGPAEIRTASGDVRLTWARDDVSVRTASGDVTIANATGDVAGMTASGDFRLASVARGSTEPGPGQRHRVCHQQAGRDRPDRRRRSRGEVPYRQRRHPDHPGRRGRARPGAGARPGARAGASPAARTGHRAHTRRVTSRSGPPVTVRQPTPHHHRKDHADEPLRRRTAHPAAHHRVPGRGGPARAAPPGAATTAPAAKRGCRSGVAGPGAPRQPGGRAGASSAGCLRWTGSLRWNRRAC